MTIVGYARVSTADQNLARQLEALNKRGCERIFQDKMSGAHVDNRKALTELRSWVRSGDIVCVLTMDRLGRSMKDFLLLMEEFKDKGVVVEFLSQPTLNTTEDNPMAEVLRVIIAAFAQMELTFIRERQREGIEEARKRGVYDRVPAMSAAQVAKAEAMIAAGVPKAEVARRLGFSRASIYRAVRREGRYADLPAVLPQPDGGAGDGAVKAVEVCSGS